MNAPPGAPKVREKVKDLIVSALDERYISHSCQDAVETGNHYQSVTLGDERTSGFRTFRAELLDQIPFAGRKVLDLGSNLGELSRLARERGATLVDGHEYDPYFVEMANLINAHNGTTRVSFHRSDITQRSLYGEHYDITLAFAVFIYVRGVMDRIAEITDELLVLETHRLDGNLESLYLETVLPYFPHHRVLGRTEWGTRMDAGVERAVVAFAKDPARLPAPPRAGVATGG
ncbi:MAG TPA: class I SAM-dependent methyltransferase [Solirubrobacteraceae bacterium]